MSREVLHESLSAVMDNEADELELRRVLAACGDAEVRATWARYQIARAAMHKQLREPRLDIAAAVSAALADEAPAAEVASRPEVVHSRSRWSGLTRVAIAASVSVAVLAGVRLYNQSEMDGPQVASQTPAQPVPQAVIAPQTGERPVLTGYNDKPVEGQAQPTGGAAPSESWQDQRIPAYLRQHSQQSAFSEGQQVSEPAGVEKR